MTTTNGKALLEVKNLEAYIPTDKGTIRPVNNVSFEINEGEIVALVGESGSGKSVSALSIMGLNDPAIKYTEDSAIYFKGENILRLKEKDFRKIRGKDIAMVFQDPMFSLNPVHPIGKQIAEPIMIHHNLKYKEVEDRVIELLKKVGIPDPENRINDYPHQLSGGMRQRVMIAIALACNPSLIIADEPTTALDVTIQAQILNLLKELQQESGISILIITHDLGVVAEIADRVLVMYCGEIVEEATVDNLFKQPRHPYTEGLLNCIPSIEGESEEMLEAIPGAVPNPLELPKGCNFSTRCPYATEECKTVKPKLTKTSVEGSQVACLYPLDQSKGAEQKDAEAISFS